MNLSLIPVVFFAAVSDPVFDLQAIMKAAVESTQNNVLGVLALVVPAIVLVVGAVVSVKFGIKWLRSLGKG